MADFTPSLFLAKIRQYLMIEAWRREQIAAIEASDTPEDTIVIAKPPRWEGRQEKAE